MEMDSNTDYFFGSLFGYFIKILIKMNFYNLLLFTLLCDVLKLTDLEKQRAVAACLGSGCFVTWRNLGTAWEVFSGFFFSHSESYNSGKAALQSSCQCGMLKGLTWGSRSLRRACGWGSHWRLLLGSPEFQAGVTQNCPGLLAVRTPVHLCLHLLLFQLAGITAVKTSLVARESEIIHLFVAVL